MINIDFLGKGRGIVSPAHFMYDFFNKNVRHVIFYQLAKFHCLVAITF